MLTLPTILLPPTTQQVSVPLAEKVQQWIFYQISQQHFCRIHPPTWCWQQQQQLSDTPPVTGSNAPNPDLSSSKDDISMLLYHLLYSSAMFLQVLPPNLPLRVTMAMLQQPPLPTLPTSWPVPPSMTMCVTFRLDFTYHADTSDCLFPYSVRLPPFPKAHVRYNLEADSCAIWSCGDPCTIWSQGQFLYDIHLKATTTTILSIRAVTIPIDLVSSATDSIRRRIVLFKLVPIPTSDPKSEFLCQSSLVVQNRQTPLNPPCTPGISPMPSQPRITHTVIALVLSLSI